MGKKTKYSGSLAERYQRGPRAGKVTGPVLLACEKCEERLAKEGRFRQIAQLQQAMESIAAEAEATGSGFRILPVSCLDVCPRGAMAVGISAPRGRGPATTMIVRTPDELREICNEIIRNHETTGVDAPPASSDARSISFSPDPQTSSPDNS